MPKVTQLIIVSAPRVPHHEVSFGRWYSSGSQEYWLQIELNPVNRQPWVTCPSSFRFPSGWTPVAKQLWYCREPTSGITYCAPEPELHISLHLSLGCPSEVRAAVLSPILQVRKLRLRMAKCLTHISSKCWCWNVTSIQINPVHVYGTPTVRHAAHEPVRL